MNQISLVELNRITQSFLEKTRVMRPDLYPIFLLQYETACRIGEAVDTDRWNVKIDYIELQPEKRNNKRILMIEDFSTETLNYLTTPRAPVPTKFYNKFQYYFKENLKPTLWIGEKRVKTHIFRHAKVKNLVNEQGATPAQIQDYLGEKTLKAAEIYINSIIYTK